MILISILLFMLQGISDNVPMVKAVVPKNQSHSFITQGSPDTMVRLVLMTIIIISFLPL